MPKKPCFEYETLRSCEYFWSDYPKLNPKCYKKAQQTLHPKLIQLFLYLFIKCEGIFYTLNPYVIFSWILNSLFVVNIWAWEVNVSSLCLKWALTCTQNFYWRCMTFMKWQWLRRKIIKYRNIKLEFYNNIFCLSVVPDTDPFSCFTKA